MFLECEIWESERQGKWCQSLPGVCRDSVGESLRRAAEERALCCLVRMKEMGAFVITTSATISPYSAQVNRYLLT